VLQDLCAVAIYLPAQDETRRGMRGLFLRGRDGRGKGEMGESPVEREGEGQEEGCGCCRWWRGGCGCWGHRPRTSAGAAGSVGACAGDTGIFDAARAERTGASSAAGNTARRRVLALLVLLASWTVVMVQVWLVLL
jgi:hypothetical protein